MRQVICNNVYRSLFILLLLPAPALAIPTITCHCFTDRSYDASRPSAADPYFLATTQNSFFAQVFNTDKKSVVMKKQQGTSPDDLWIAYWVASRTGASPEVLLQTKQKSEAWKDAIAQMGLPLKTLGTRFSSALKANSSPLQLAETAVDDLYARYRLMGEVELAAMRKAGASNQELIISSVIAGKIRLPARKIYLEVKNSSKTWGSFLREAKIDTKNMQQEITSILKLQPR